MIWLFLACLFAFVLFLRAIWLAFTPARPDFEAAMPTSDLKAELDRIQARLALIGTTQRVAPTKPRRRKAKTR